MERKEKMFAEFLDAYDAGRNVVILKTTLSNGAKEIIVNCNAFDKMVEIRDYYNERLEAISPMFNKCESIDSYMFCDTLTESAIKIMMQGCDKK